MHTRHTVIDTVLGPVTMVARGEALVGLYFEEHVRRPALYSVGPHVRVAADGLCADAVGQLHDCLAGRRAPFAVWRARPPTDSPTVNLHVSAGVD